MPVFERPWFGRLRAEPDPIAALNILAELRDRDHRPGLPQAHSREISHRAGNPDGTYQAGNQDYWREITEALALLRLILRPS